MSNTTTLMELRRIYQQNGNKITPSDVVDAARPEDSPLHSRFEWDDSVAGEKYREAQAAQLIRTVRIEVSTGTERGVVKVRAFLSTNGSEIAEERGDPWTYSAIEDIDTPTSKVLLGHMQRDVAMLRRKYRDHRAALDALLLGTIGEDDDAA